MKLKDIIEPNELDKKAKRVLTKLPGIYDKKNLNIGAKTGVEVDTVEIKDTATGQVYGRRSIYQKGA